MTEKLMRRVAGIPPTLIDSPSDERASGEVASLFMKELHTQT